jgi:LacI family transcriptional regulator
MGVTLKDVARDLGVSIVTVSKVLRNHDDIGPATRARVQKRLKELNYQPNLAARALVTGRTSLMGLVVPDLVHSFFAQLAKELSRVLRRNGYGLIISSSDEDPELENEEIAHMLARNVDVLLVASAQPDAFLFRQLAEQRKSFVLIDRHFDDLKANFIGTDDRRAGMIATEHLIENGCRRIAHIAGQGISPAKEREEGYRSALMTHGLPAPDSYVSSQARGDESGNIAGYDAMKTLLKLTPRPDGVFCHNDPMACGAMQAILEAGLRIPRDIAIVGCGNMQYAPMLRVPLTSIDQDSATLAERAAKLALSLSGKKDMARAKVILTEPKLVVRESSLRNSI